VLGNHDYSMYQIGTPKIKAENERKIQEYEKAIGWHLLNNEHKAFYSPNRKDSIIIAGEGNCGTGRFPNKSDIKKTMRGVKKNDIVIFYNMIQLLGSQGFYQIVMLADIKWSYSWRSNKYIRIATYKIHLS